MICPNAVQVAVQISVNQMGVFGQIKEWMALVVLALVLLALAFDIAHRVWIAFIGSFAMLGQSLRQETR